MTTKHNVPYVAQLRTHSCWYASTQMVWKFRHASMELGVTPDFTKRADASGDAFSTLLARSPVVGTASDEATGATEKDWPILGHLGFQQVPCQEVESIRSMDVGFDLLEALLTTKGPLWCAGFFFDAGRKDMSQGGHAIVLTGAHRKNGWKDGVKVSQPYIFYNDPAAHTGGRRDREKSFAWFQTSLFNTTTESEGISPIWHLPQNEQALANWAKLRAAVTAGRIR